jgi:hypothetical protein
MVAVTFKLEPSESVPERAKADPAILPEMLKDEMQLAVKVSVPENRIEPSGLVIPWVNPPLTADDPPEFEVTVPDHEPVTVGAGVGLGVGVELPPHPAIRQQRNTMSRNFI